MSEPQTIENANSYVSLFGNSSDVGYRHGYPFTQSPRIWTPGLRVDCAYCGDWFTPDRANYLRGAGRFCSVDCSNASRTGNLISDYSEDTKARRVRANGLINKRIKLGRLVRPDACQLCAKKCKPDFHHPDYSRPDYGAWVCRSCHSKCNIHKAWNSRAIEVSNLNAAAVRSAKAGHHA